jgi:carboxylesterase
MTFTGHSTPQTVPLTNGDGGLTTPDNPVDTGIQAVARHYSTEEILGFTAPGVAYQIQVPSSRRTDRHWPARAGFRRLRAGPWRVLRSRGRMTALLPPGSHRRRRAAMSSPTSAIDHSPTRHDGSTDIGVLLCHGFTGSPHSMRPWAQHVIAQDWSVRLPLLPGHGTHWRDANRTTWQDWYATVDAAFAELTDRCAKVFVFGLSMGGTLALRLAEQHGPDVAGLVLVNPAVIMLRWDAKFLPLLGRVLPSVPAIGNDIAKPGVLEGAYDRTPVRAAASLRQLQATVRGELGKVTQPVRLYHSANDHVVEPVNSAMILQGIASTDVEEIVLDDSYHVATLDHDAERIFSGSVDFVKRLAVA